MAKVTRIYQDAVDKNVASIIAYASADTDYPGLYYDADFSEKIPASEVENLFFKGLVVSGGGEFIFPTALIPELKVIYLGENSISYGDPEDYEGPGDAEEGLPEGN